MAFLCLYENKVVAIQELSKAVKVHGLSFLKDILNSAQQKRFYVMNTAISVQYIGAYDLRSKLQVSPKFEFEFLKCLCLGGQVQIHSQW